MKQLHKISFFLLCLCFVAQITAQVDNNSGRKEKGKIKSIILKNSKEVKKPKSIELDGSDGFKKAHKVEQEKLKKKKEEEALNKRGIITKSMLRRDLFKKYMEKHTLQIPMIDKDIGVFRTKSINIYISSFDFGVLDGDKITILKNGKPIIENYTLEPEYVNKVIKIPIDPGFNKIEILATDEGYLRPNSGAFTLFDDFKEEVFSDFWYLAKGAKVIAHIIREEK